MKVSLARRLSHQTPNLSPPHGTNGPGSSQFYAGASQLVDLLYQLSVFLRSRNYVCVPWSVYDRQGAAQHYGMIAEGFERVGYALTCLVGVRLQREGSAENRGFKAKMLRHRRVQQCYSVTGDVDFMLVVLSRDIHDFESFAQATLYSDDNVRTFTTFVVLDRVKFTAATPSEPRGE